MTEAQRQSTGASGARYEQIAEQMRESIRTGARQVGQSLESEAALAAEYRVAPGTVREALRLLVSEGTLGGRRGARKTVLRRPRPAAVAEEFRSFAQWASAHGRTPGGHVIEQNWRIAGRRRPRHSKSTPVHVCCGFCVCVCSTGRRSWLRGRATPSSSARWSRRFPVMRHRSAAASPSSTESCSPVPIMSSQPPSAANRTQPSWVSPAGDRCCVTSAAVVTARGLQHHAHARAHRPAVQGADVHPVQADLPAVDFS